MFLTNNQIEDLAKAAADNWGCKYMQYKYKYKHVYHADTMIMLTSTIQELLQQCKKTL